MASDRDTVNPNACAVCDVDREEHLTRYSPDETAKSGWHQWVAPTDVQRKARLVARRAPERGRDTLAALPGVTVHNDELHHAIDRSLAGLYTDWNLGEGLPAPVTVAVHIERDLRAADWRPPARVITDPDTPDTFPARTVGVDRDGEVWVSRFTDWIVAFDVTARGERLGDIVADVGPLTIVFVPIEEAGR